MFKRNITFSSHIRPNVSFQIYIIYIILINYISTRIKNTQHLETLYNNENHLSWGLLRKLVNFSSWQVYTYCLPMLFSFISLYIPPLYSGKAWHPFSQWPTLLIASNCHLLAAQHQKWGSPGYEGFWLALPTSGPYATSFYRGVRTRRLRLLDVAFVRPIMNSPSFVEGGSFLCWHPQNWDRCVAGEVVRRKVDVRGKRAIYEPTLPLWGGGFEPRLNFKHRFVDTRLTFTRRLSSKQDSEVFAKTVITVIFLNIKT